MAGIGPKGKISKSRGRNEKGPVLENQHPESCKMQQMRRAYGIP